MAPTYDEVLQANTEAVASLEKRLQVVQQILEEIANEVGWVTRNLHDLSIGGVEVSDAEFVQCMECEAGRVRGLAEALRRKWTDLMLHAGRYVGLCPACSEDIERSKAADASAAATRHQTITVDAEQFARAMENVEVLSDNIEENLEPEGKTCAVGSREPASRSGRRADGTNDRRRPKQQPLYMRMFQDRHMTALVRAVGHAGFPASEVRERLDPLIAAFGEALIRAATDEVTEVDNTQNPPMLRLKAEARTVALGLLGRPPQEQPQSGIAPTADELPPAKDAAAEDAKPRRRKKSKADWEK